MSWMSSTSRRLIYPAVVVVTAAVVGGWAAWAGGRSSVAFLVGATLAMGWVVWLAFRAAQALVKDAPVREAGEVVTGGRRKELEREKQSLLKALKELDFDHQMGKVSDKDFNDISATYRARAIRVMRQLDVAFDILLAGRRIGEHGRQQVIGLHALDRQRDLLAAAKPD